MAERTEQINVRITESKKQKWKQFDEESRTVDGISDLIRKAVGAYIGANGNPRAIGGPSDQSGGNVPDDLSSRLASIEDRISDVGTTVERIDESTGFIESKIVESKDDMTLSDKLMRILPPAKPTTSEWETDKEQFEERPEGEPIIWDGTVEEFAESLEADSDLIVQALESATHNVDIPVETGDVAGERRYWASRDLNFALFADGRMSEDERLRPFLDSDTEGQ